MHNNMARQGPDISVHILLIDGTRRLRNLLIVLDFRGGAPVKVRVQLYSLTVDALELCRGAWYAR